MVFNKLIHARVLSNSIFSKQKIKGRNIAGLFLLALQVACQPAVSTPPPTPEVLRVAYTPAVQGLGDALHRCAGSLPLIGLAVDEVPASLLGSRTDDLTFRLGLPEKSPAYAAVIGWDEIVVVVNSSNGVTSFPVQMVSNIYNGETTHWDEVTAEGMNQPIQVWSYPLGDELRQVFQAAFLGTENPAKQTYLAPDAPAMLEAISKNPSALGFLLKSQLNDSVRQVIVNGETDSSLRQPILALAQAEPQGNLRQLVLCLQKP